MYMCIYILMPVKISVCAYVYVARHTPGKWRETPSYIGFNYCSNYYRDCEPLTLLQLS